MRIDLYTRCWDEADMLGFFFRHYDALVERYVVFDDGSTDGSKERLRAHPRVDLRPMPSDSEPDSRVASGLSVLESCWKESRGRADWVIVTDLDEHLHHRDLANYLLRCKTDGVTIVPALGYQMVSDTLPPDGYRLSESRTRGAPWPMLNKMNIFDPDAIDATNFAPGRHTAAPEGRIVAPDRDEVLLLHYKYLGFERTRLRYQRALARQRKIDVERHWGFQYAWTRDQLLEDWSRVSAASVDVVAAARGAWQTHPRPRWWEEFRSSKRLGR